MKKISYITPLVHYLTINGKYLTPNTSIFPNSVVVGGITGNALTDWRAMPNIKELDINITVQAVAGVGPTLTVNFLVLDPIESSNNISTAGNPPVLTLPLNSAPLSATGVLRLVIANGVATAWVNSVATVLGNLNVPFKWQVQFVVGGTSPSFSIIGTYEGRE